MNHKKVIYVLMILAMVAWGETWVRAKIVSRYLEANELIFWRFFFTTIGMFPILFFMKLSLKIGKRNLFLALVSAIILTVYNYFFFLGTTYGLASFGGVLVTTLNPIFTFILVSFMSRKIFSPKESLGLFVGSLGALIMLKIWHFNLAEILTRGNIYFLLASVTWPILTVTSSRQSSISPVVFSFYMFGFTAILSIMLPTVEIHNILHFDALFWVNMILLAFWGTSFATTVYFVAVSKLGSKTASSFFFLVPAGAIFFAILFLDESIELSLLIGGALTVAAVYLLNGIASPKNTVVSMMDRLAKSLSGAHRN